MRPRLTSALAFIFFFSGLASLIYQVVWQRILTLHYGVGDISITLIVSVYMFGLGIGGLVGGFLAERFKNRLALFFFVQLLVGLFGLISLPFLRFLGDRTAGSDYWLSSFWMFLFLAFPTLLMGLTLPLLTKIFNGLTQNFVRSVSTLYFINTLGAAVGAILASYGLISFFGLDTAVYVAAVINLLLALLTYLTRYLPSDARISREADEPSEAAGSGLGKKAYVLVLGTGFLAIGYELIWFRVVRVLLKDSPYAFSSALSVYLFGIAFGSLAMKKLLRKRKKIDRKSLFFTLQLLIGVAVMVIFMGYFYLTKYTPLEVFSRTSFYSLLHPTFDLPSFRSIDAFVRDLFLLGDVFFWPAVFIFVPTALMGASFPLISSLALSKPDREGRTVGTVFFFNVGGNVLGGILTGFLILPRLGTEAALMAFSSAGVLLGIFATGLGGQKLSAVRRACLIVVPLVVCAAFFPRPGRLYEAMHFSPGASGEVYFEEGVDGVIMTYQSGEILYNFISGLPHGGRPGHGFIRKTVEAVSFAPKVDKALIIGFGTGSFAEAVLRLDDLGGLTVVEISDTLMRNLKKLAVFRDMLADSRLNLVIEDGRRYLLRTPETYDLILMDPLRPTTSYSNNLDSREFYELAKKHLNPGGVMMIYLGESRVMPKTVLSVFSHVRVYRYDGYFCLASDGPLTRDSDRERRLLEKFPGRDGEIMTKIDLGYVGDENYIGKIASGFPINRDWKPVSEYYLGLKVKEKFFEGN